MEKNIMVFLEYRKKRLAEVSLELLCKARSLADELKSKVIGLAIGYGLEGLNKLGEYGADLVVYVEDENLSSYRTLPFAKAVVSVIKKYCPYIVLFGATPIGRDLAPRVASNLRVGLTADCTELQIGEYKAGKNTYKDQLLQIRPAWGGNIIATIVSPDSVPSMATVRDGVMPISNPIPGRKAEVEHFFVEFSENDLLTEIIEEHVIKKEVDLKRAKIIVGAGMGAANERSMELIFELANVLKAEVGGTRPLIDAGFLSRDRQIGQTGVTVRPNLYIACGISGQIQHQAGILDSKRIIAINKDKDAPIFNIAHYKIVGDLNEVIPLMTEGYKKALCRMEKK